MITIGASVVTTVVLSILLLTEEIVEKALVNNKKIEGEILEAEVCLNHIHVKVEISPNVSVLVFVGYLKEKSSIDISAMRKGKIQKQKPRVLVSRILRCYRKIEYQKDCRIHLE